VVLSLRVMPVRYLLEFIFLASIWGGSFLFTKGAAAEFGPVATAALRVGLASLILLPVLLWRGQTRELYKHWKPLVVVGLFNSGIPFLLYAYAVLYISTGLSSILNATTPLFGAVVAWLWLKDRPSPLRVLGLMIGFVGVAYLAWNKASFKPGGTGWAVVACLGATTCYAIAASTTKRYLSQVPALAVTTGSQVFAALVLLIPAFWAWPPQMPGLHAWGSIFVLALVCTSLAYLLFFHLISHLGPAKVISVTFLIPVFGVFYGALLLGEQVTPVMITGSVIVLIGTALAVGLVGEPKPKPQAETT
jgi:drug/metabolite transporter (DMT)-like permease